MGIVVIGDVLLILRIFLIPVYPAGKKCRNGHSDPWRSSKKCGGEYRKHRVKADVHQRCGQQRDG